MKSVRLGKPEAGKNRLILVTLRHEEDAKYLHNYKYGRKVELEDGSGHLWINADLTKMERDTAYERRQEFRARRRAPARSYGGLDPSSLDEDDEPAVPAAVAASNVGQTPNGRPHRQSPPPYRQRKGNSNM